MNVEQAFWTGMSIGAMLTIGAWFLDNLIRRGTGRRRR